VMAGGKRIVEVFVVADRIDRERVPGGRFCTPCGGCRQRLAEFAGPDVRVHAADPDGNITTFLMSQLLPAGFSLETEQ
jgi:cytidine deaminase